MRIDLHPLDTVNNFKVRPGLMLANGAHIVPGGVNFTIYSSGAKSCTLVLYHSHDKKPFATIPFPQNYKIGNVFSMIVFDLDYENLEYGFQIEGEYNFQRGDVFDKTKVLLDPYAKIISGRDVWGEDPDWENEFQYRAKISLDDFDWEGDMPLKNPHNELIIYEAHVRGFTKDESSGVKFKGTYAGLIEKIPYLKELGVNALELLPIFEFDEFEGAREINGQKLMNYWGYSTVGFFAPKAGYAASGKYSMQIDEFKNLVKELHKAGIRVILDVVFNHTAEGNEHGPYISFKGIDNKTYYILTPDGYYYNFSGCGNTLNCNNPIVRTFILTCLRYWVSTYHIDGFRFDLAAILGRDANGAPMANPPLLESLAYDPVLSDSILIAEAWDAGGLYQVGSFPNYGRWAEWNGKYRDDLRKFLKGESGKAECMAYRISGSEDIYNTFWRGDCASVNFITCHDGFTLYDLFAYNDKHNEANGWGGSDGGNDNDSWNCGWEGDTNLPSDIKYLRHKMIKNAAAILLTSWGIPMILAGDEFGNTQYGNNNPYCQDNKISWLDWNDLNKNQDLFKFFKKMIAFRKAHPVLMRMSSGTPLGYPAVSMHGTNAWQFDYSPENRVLGVMFAGRKDNQDDFVYIGINTHWESHGVWLPQLPQNMSWQVEINTDLGENAVYDVPAEINSSDQFIIGARSVIVCTSKING